MESRNYAKQREIGALSAQLEAALYVNTKLNSEVSPEKRFLIRTNLLDEEDETPKKKDEPKVEKGTAKPKAEATKKYDTSVDAV